MISCITLGGKRPHLCSMRYSNFHIEYPIWCTSEEIANTAGNVHIGRMSMNAFFGSCTRPDTFCMSAERRLSGAEYSLIDGYLLLNQWGHSVWPDFLAYVAAILISSVNWLCKPVLKRNGIITICRGHWLTYVQLCGLGHSSCVYEDSDPLLWNALTPLLGRAAIPLLDRDRYLAIL